MLSSDTKDMLRGFIALSFLLLFSIPTVYRLLLKQLDVGRGVSVLVFALIVSFGIMNYDVIERIRWGTMEVETAKKAISKEKESAIEEIKNEVAEQKESVEVLISDVSKTKTKTEEQRKALSELIKKASELQRTIENQKMSIKALNQEGLNTKSEIEKLNNASAKVALIFVRATYLSLATRNEIDSIRVKKAFELMSNDLTEILPVVIPDEKERSVWIDSLKRLLPARK